MVQGLCGFAGEGKLLVDMQGCCGLLVWCMCCGGSEICVCMREVLDNVEGLCLLGYVL